jgi:hypothetical protein
LAPELSYAACGGDAIASQLVGDLTRILDTPPVAIILTSQGVQPLWPVNDAVIGEDFTQEDAQQLLDEFAAVVTKVASCRGAKVVGAINLADLAPVPGTASIECCGVDGGESLTRAQLTAVLEQYQPAPAPDDTSTDRGAMAPAVVALHMFLAGGPRWASDAIVAAHEAGISREALKAAKRQLKVISRRVGVPGRWYWALPEHSGQLPLDVDIDHPQLSSEVMAAALDTNTNGTRNHD